MLKAESERRNGMSTFRAVESVPRPLHTVLRAARSQTTVAAGKKPNIGSRIIQYQKNSFSVNMSFDLKIPMC